MAYDTFRIPNLLSFPSTVLLGGAVSAYKGTTDNTFYTHYSGMSSVQNNWGLGSLGRQDTNMTVAQVFQFQANMTGYRNVAPTEDPLTNLTGVFPGVCNPAMWVPVTAPNVSGGGFFLEVSEGAFFAFAPCLRWCFLPIGLCYWCRKWIRFHLQHHLQRQPCQLPRNEPHRPQHHGPYHLPAQLHPDLREPERYQHHQRCHGFSFSFLDWREFYRKFWRRGKSGCCRCWCGCSDDRRLWCFVELGPYLRVSVDGLK